MHSMPSQLLPLQPQWSSTEEYVESLLAFVTQTDLFRNLCGGVHILDFLTRKPDLYSWVLPQDWRDWVDVVDIHDFLELLLKEDLANFELDHGSDKQHSASEWKGYPSPPESLVQYIKTVRAYSLARQFVPVSTGIEPLPRHISFGMRPKKIHEVTNFAAFVDNLSASISKSTNTPLSIIDFGSGQNYLGRALACPPYNKYVVAIEQRHHNVVGAKGMDVLAKLAKKERIMRNKKEYKRRLALMKDVDAPTTPSLESLNDTEVSATPADSGTHTPVVEHVPGITDPITTTESSKGTITYIEHSLESGHLEHILQPPNSTNNHNQPHPPPKSLVVSIHSCGNLTHHGLRSITLNPSVQAVAMIGCCYNLLTERLGPSTYKHPQLRPNHPRLTSTSSTYDPHGFPMSKRLEEFDYNTPTADGSTQVEKGVRLNITARMMAVQAPYNWGRPDSESFFTRHFYRALLQRILLDRGVVKQALSSDDVNVAGGSLSGKDALGTPLIIGTLPKSAFVSFGVYVRAALRKLTVGNADVEEGMVIQEKTADLLVDDGRVVKKYEERFAYARKELAVIWSLMAFSAGVVESVVVVDRWLWLKEQDEVKDAWVETVFDYALSPRNLCVVGVKRDQ